MPSSINTLYAEGVPSSSIVKEPRRSGSVPSSTTVTPFAATCCPIWPEKVEVFLRLKSPSRPWPTASCSMTPGQPGPSTTVISPAGAGTDPRLTSACRNASSTCARQFRSMGIAGRLAGHRAQPEALGRVERGALDAAVVERDAFRLAVFEKQLAIIHAGERLADQLLNPAGIHSGAVEKQVVGHGKIAHRRLQAAVSLRIY